MGKLLSPSRRRACIDHIRGSIRVSERRVCRVLGQHRSTQWRLPVDRADEDRLVADMIELTCQFGRCGYRRIAVLLRDAGWLVNDKRPSRQICVANRLPGNGRTPMATRGAQSAREAAQERPALAKRRLMCPVAT